jgi:hypothetical protein
MGKWAGKMRDSWMKWIDTRFVDRIGQGIQLICVIRCKLICVESQLHYQKIHK